MKLIRTVHKLPQYIIFGMFIYIYGKAEGEDLPNILDDEDEAMWKNALYEVALWMLNASGLVRLALTYLLLRSSTYPSEEMWFTKKAKNRFARVLRFILYGWLRQGIEACGRLFDCLKDLIKCCCNSSEGIKKYEGKEIYIPSGESLAWFVHIYSWHFRFQVINFIFTLVFILVATYADHKNCLYYAFHGSDDKMEGFSIRGRLIELQCAIRILWALVSIILSAIFYSCCCEKILPEFECKTRVAKFEIILATSSPESPRVIPVSADPAGKQQLDSGGLEVTTLLNMKINGGEVFESEKFHIKIVLEFVDKEGHNTSPSKKKITHSTAVLLSDVPPDQSSTHDERHRRSISPITGQAAEALRADETEEIGRDIKQLIKVWNAENCYLPRTDDEDSAGRPSEFSVTVTDEEARSFTIHYSWISFKWWCCMLGDAAKWCFKYCPRCFEKCGCQRYRRFEDGAKEIRNGRVAFIFEDMRKVDLHSLRLQISNGLKEDTVLPALERLAKASRSGSSISTELSTFDRSQIRPTFMNTSHREIFDALTAKDQTNPIVQEVSDVEEGQRSGMRPTDLLYRQFFRFKFNIEELDALWEAMKLRRRNNDTQEKLQQILNNQMIQISGQERIKTGSAEAKDA